MVTKRVLFLALLFWLLPVVGRCQIASVMTEYGELLPSRGALSVIRGANLATVTEQAVDLANLPTDLGGVRVDVNGVLCGLRFVSPDTVRLVIPDEAPFFPPVRLRPNVITVRNADGQVWWRRVYLNDTSPWLLTQRGSEHPVGITHSLANGLQTTLNGIVNVAGDTRVQIWATGARSFYQGDWVFYYVYLIDSGENVYELPARVSKSLVVEGMDYVTFDIPAAYTNMGPCRLLLRTPSAFSQEVQITITGN